MQNKQKSRAQKRPAENFYVLSRYYTGVYAYILARYFLCSVGAEEQSGICQVFRSLSSVERRHVYSELHHDGLRIVGVSEEETVASSGLTEST